LNEGAEAFIAASLRRFASDAHEGDDVVRGDEQHRRGTHRRGGGHYLGRSGEPIHGLPYRHDFEKMSDAAANDEETKSPKETGIRKV